MPMVGLKEYYNSDTNQKPLSQDQKSWLFLILVTMPKTDIRTQAHKEVLDYLTGGNPEEDFIHFTVGADDYKQWWIRGAQSNYVQKQKLEFAIDVLNDVIKNNGGQYLIHSLRELEQELKQIQ